MNNRMTYEEHEEIALKLHETREWLLHWMSAHVFGVYPKTGPKSKYQTALLKVVSAIDHAKATGDSFLCGEHPDLFDVHTYYPQNVGQPGEHGCVVCGGGYRTTTSN